MGSNTTNKKKTATIAEVTKTYLDSVEILQHTIRTSRNKAARKAARASVTDLSIQFGHYQLDKIAGRTALLNALIVELGEVIDAVKVNPIGESLDKLAGISDTAKKLLDEGKKKLNE